MRFTCRINKMKIEKCTHNVYLWLFYSKCGRANAPHCNVILTLSLLCVLLHYWINWHVYVNWGGTV